MENPNQTAQMVSWLDEERRKDKALITKLEERSQAQSALIEDQARRIRSLENEITSLRSSILTSSTFEEAVERLRNELTNSLDQLEERRISAEQELKKMRELDREALTKSIEELRQEMISRIDRAVKPRRTEEERLSRVAVELQSYADSLSKGMEEFERSLAFLEEQRRQDTKRLSDVNTEISALSKKTESQQAKVELLEDLSRRNERNVTELTGTLNEFKQQRQEWNEQQALADQQRERTMNEMVNRMDSFAEDMAGFSKQFESWSNTHRQMNLKVDEFERLADRVERRLNEASEMQRLSEERFRQEWEDFLGDDQQRWRQFTISNEEAWRENEKTLEEVQSEITQVSELSERQTEHIRYLRAVQQRNISQLMEQVQMLREQAEDDDNALPALS